MERKAAGPSWVLAAYGVLAMALLLAGALFWSHPAPRPAPPPKPLRSAGGKVYDKWCSDCHTRADGPGTVALQRKYKGAVPGLLEQRQDLNPDYIKIVVRQGISFMPSFRKTEISDAELALLANYLVPSQVPSGNDPLPKNTPGK